MSWLFLGVLPLALAAPINDEPLMSLVELPSTGTAAISIPVEMRVRYESAGDYLLLDGNGQEVPFVWVTNSDRRNLVAQVAPTSTPDTYVVSVDEPADGLTLRLPTDARATVTVASSTGQVVGEAFVWNLGSSSALDVPLAVPSVGRLSVRYTWLAERPESAPDVAAWAQDLRLETESIPLTASAPSVDGSGRTWWEVSLPRAYTEVDSKLQLDLAGEAFDRVVTVTAGGPDGNGIGGARVFRNGSAAQLSVPLWSPGREMSVGLEPARDPAPALQSAALQFREARLFVRDAGPGPHTLYGGRHRAVTRQAYDLDAARNELLRARPTPVEPDAPKPNPAYVPPEVAANLVAPGQELQLPRWTWQRAIAGQGLVEIDLPPDVLARSLVDLSDVRVIDATGHELPRTVALATRRLAWTALTPTRTEDGRHTVLELALPEADLTVSSVRLRSDATVFTRDVTLERPAKLGPELIGASAWTGNPDGSTFELAVGERVGGVLRVVIDNGSDAPLPISEVAVAYPRWTLVTYVPPAGATLVYGNHAAKAPEFDLSALNEELRDRGPASAPLGEPVAVEHPKLPLWDSALLIVGLFIASLALLAVTVRAALAAPPAAPPPVVAPTDASAT